MRSIQEVVAHESHGAQEYDESRLIEALEAREGALLARIHALQEALIWCSGSGDFAPDGPVRAGWEGLCKPLLTDPDEKYGWAVPAAEDVRRHNGEWLRRSGHGIVCCDVKVVPGDRVVYYSGGSWMSLRSEALFPITRDGWPAPWPKKAET